MESGTRTEKYFFTTGPAAVDIDRTVTQAFKLTEVVVNFWSDYNGGAGTRAVPTTSENLTIRTVHVCPDAATGTMRAQQFITNPSLSGIDSLPIRFDKDFGAGTTITVDYANTDNYDIEVMLVYLLQDSVTNDD